jgi:membrane associated rhomboid family serine protease
MVNVERLNAIHQQIVNKKRGVMLIAPGFNVPTMGCLLLVAIHAWVFFTGGTHLTPNLLRPLYESVAVSWSGIQGGRVAALFTHSFFHGNWTHVLVNALLFFYAAARLGHVLRPSRILLLFVICSLGAASIYVISQALMPGISPNPLVGASGGVMGMLLAQTVIYPDSKMLLLPISGRNMGKGLLVASLLLFLMTPGLGIPLFCDFGQWMAEGFGRELFEIGHLYHFVGGLLGMTSVGLLLPRLVTLEDLKFQRTQREGGMETTR